MPLITELNELGRSHAGLICIPKSIRNREFGVIISAIERTLEDATTQEEWIDRVAWARRSSRRR